MSSSSISLNICSLNVGSGGILDKLNRVRYSIDASKKILVNFIRNNNIDILCLQEVVLAPESDSMCKTVLESTDLAYNEDFILSASPFDQKLKIGVAVLSKYPIKRSSTFFLHNPNIYKFDRNGNLLKSHDKGGLVVEIGLREAIQIACVHSFPFSFFNVSEFSYQCIFTNMQSILLSSMNTSDVSVICADFNSTYSETLMPVLFNTYRSAFYESTRPHGAMDDYILCSKTSRINNKQVIKTAYDHYALLVQLSLF